MRVVQRVHVLAANDPEAFTFEPSKEALLGIGDGHLLIGSEDAADVDVGIMRTLLLKDLPDVQLSGRLPGAADLVGVVVRMRGINLKPSFDRIETVFGVGAGALPVGFI